MADIFQSLVQLVTTLGRLLLEVGALALANALLIAWIAWWLCGVNWNKAWPVLAKGGWTVVVLLAIVAAIAWSAMFPSNQNFLESFTIPNFYWQLGAITLLVVTALFCGWLQGVFSWAPAEIDLEPAPEAGDHGHH